MYLLDYHYFFIWCCVTDKTYRRQESGPTRTIFFFMQELLLVLDLAMKYYVFQLYHVFIYSIGGLSTSESHVHSTLGARSLPHYRFSQCYRSHKTISGALLLWPSKVYTVKMRRFASDMRMVVGLPMDLPGFPAPWCWPPSNLSNILEYGLESHDESLNMNGIALNEQKFGLTLIWTFLFQNVM